MFDSPYHYEFRMNKKPDLSDKFIKRGIYSFKDSDNKAYLVYVEEYDYQVFIVKFHLKSHSDSDNKYNLLTSSGYPSRVIATCVKIMLDHHSENHFSSYGFIGSNLIGEPKSNTKRFRIYKSVMLALFSPQSFDHKFNENGSAYLLLNKANKEPNLLEKVEIMFEKLYYEELT